MSKRREPPIVDPATYPRRSVNLTTAADFLGIHVRTVRSRIEAGLLSAWRDGNCYKIRVTALVRYKASPPEARDDG